MEFLIWGNKIISMTQLLSHTLAHLTGSSFRLKAKLLPIKNILGVKYKLLILNLEVQTYILLYFLKLSPIFVGPTLMSIHNHIEAHSCFCYNIPYARHYKPRLVYFLPHFQRPFMYCDLWPYAWLVFKSGF